MTEKFKTISDYEKAAVKLMSENAKSYINSGSNSEWALDDSIEQFNRYEIRSRIGNDTSEITLNSKILTEKTYLPFGIAPTAMQKLVHPDGEIGNATAADEKRTIYTLSTVSTTSLEDVAKSTKHKSLFFQLYAVNNKEVQSNLIKRAEDSGYKALCLTVDSPINGKREKEIRDAFYLPSHLILENLKAMLEITKSKLPPLREFQAQRSRNLIWNDIKLMKQTTKLPIILKGITNSEDA